MPMKKTALLMVAPLLALTACTVDADPEDVDWEVVSSTDIVAIDDNTGAYISGSMFGIDSKTVIDYKYAKELSSGGVRQAMVSDLWKSDAEHGFEYPGAKAVTIYQDIDENNADKARIEVLKCDPPDAPDDSEEGEISPLTPFTTPIVECTMPDGSPMGSRQHRIDIHVPEGSVVDTESLERDSDREG